MNQNKIQFDKSVRVVSLENLAAMCARVSGTAHTYRIAGVSDARVRVSYSNPDEHGSPQPIVAYLPCYPVSVGAMAVVLDVIRYTRLWDDSEAWQAFDQLWQCEELWRNAEGKWQSEYEILSAQYPTYQITQRWVDACTQVWDCNGSTFKSHKSAAEYAVKAMRSVQQMEREQREIARIT